MKAKSSTPAAAVKWEEQPLEWPRAAGQVDQLMAALDVRRKRQRRRTVAAAAAIASAACLWFFVAHRVSAPVAPFAPDTRAIVVVPEHRTLPDGSLVELKPGAELAVNFIAGSNGPRLVALTHGMAHFQVVKNPDRPFVVSAGGVRFRAVGTAFAVSFGDATVEMLVTEGRVAVETATQGTGTVSEIAVVDAGSRVVVGTATPAAPVVARVSAADARETLAWRVPRLEFNETPLREVVRLLNAHSGRRVNLADDMLGGLEISGALRADNLEPLLEVLATTYGIVAERRGASEIVLRSGR